MKALTVLTLTLLGSAAVSHADELTFEFSTNNVPIYDSSGSYHTNSHGGFQDYTLLISPQGRLSGPFTAEVNESGAHLFFNGRISGLVRGNTVVLTPDDFRMSVNINANFHGTVYGRSIQGVETARAVLKPDDSMQTLVGRQMISVCVAARGCRNTQDRLEIPLSAAGPSESPGNWTLALDLTDRGPRVSGTALVTLANGRIFHFKARGQTPASTGISRVVLTGTREATGVVLTLQLNEARELLAVRGRLLGQRFDWHAPL